MVIVLLFSRFVKMNEWGMNESEEIDCDMRDRVEVIGKRENRSEYMKMNNAMPQLCGTCIELNYIPELVSCWSHNLVHR